jgi:hypothetical protein
MKRDGSARIIRRWHPDISLAHLLSEMYLTVMMDLAEEIEGMG